MRKIRKMRKTKKSIVFFLVGIMALSLPIMSFAGMAYGEQILFLPTESVYEKETLVTPAEVLPPSTDTASTDTSSPDAPSVDAPTTDNDIDVSTYPDAEIALPPVADENNTVNEDENVRGGAPVRRCKYSRWEPDTVRSSQPPLLSLGAEAVRLGLSVGREQSEP